MTALSEEAKLRKSLYSFVIARSRELVQLSGLREPPFQPAVMARYQGITVVPTLLGSSLSALLIPLGNGRFIARVNSAHSQERQNFSLAHEIGHTFLMEPDASQVVERLIGLMGIEKYRGFEETWCNVAASELLMPDYVFQQYASRYGFSIEAVVPLSRTFCTSVEATAIRLAKVSPKPCYVVRWTDSTESTPEQPKLRVAWAASHRTRLSEGRNTFLSLRTFTDKDSGPMEAYRSHVPTYSTERFGFGKFSMLCDIQSQGFGKGENRYVVSLIFPHESRE